MIKIYLASPYYHHDPRVRSDRVELASMTAARLMEQGFVVYSPITHGHNLADHLLPANAHSHDFWMRQSIAMLQACDRLCVLPTPGWQESKGLREELQCAEFSAMPVYVVKQSSSDFSVEVWQELTDVAVLLSQLKAPTK